MIRTYFLLFRIEVGARSKHLNYQSSSEMNLSNYTRILILSEYCFSTGGLRFEIVDEFLCKRAGRDISLEIRAVGGK